MNELIDYYRSQGAPGDQQMLIALLREAQEHCGGALTQAALEQIAQSLSIKQSMLTALIRQVPSLRLDTAPHLLEMCQSCPKGRELRTWADGLSPSLVRVRFVPCMKNCQNGPSVKWDGQLYSHATKELIRQLIEGR